MSKITDFIRDFGIGRKYYGVGYTDMAIALIKEDENRLYHLRRGIYEEIAKKKGCQPETVESDIRTVVRLMWRRKKQRLRKVAGYELPTEPSVRQFLEILYNYDQRS